MSRKRELGPATRPADLLAAADGFRVAADGGCDQELSLRAGCHQGHLLGLRRALFEGRIGEATFQAAAEYQSPVALFGSGSGAADHGQPGVEQPSAGAAWLIDKIDRNRDDLRT
ncbi:DUF6283 family protein [Streptomyces sp. NPDC048179]|uniref:DUF6283 family protein n=1 Tax=Streptomyces sp. NPDC048179 TaxID=3365506 RepID=UPI00371F21BC